MTWDEAVKHMRAGMYVTRPRMYSVLALRPAVGIDGKRHLVLCNVGAWAAPLTRIQPQWRTATDWQPALMRVA